MQYGASPRSYLIYLKGLCAGALPAAWTVDQRPLRTTPQFGNAVRRRADPPRAEGYHRTKSERRSPLAAVGHSDEHGCAYRAKLSLAALREHHNDCLLPCRPWLGFSHVEGCTRSRSPLRCSRCAAIDTSPCTRNPSRRSDRPPQRQISSRICSTVSFSLGRTLALRRTAFPN